MLINKIFINSLIKTNNKNLLYQSNLFFFAKVKSLSNEVPDSDSIIDPMYYQKNTLISNLINKFKTNNVLGDCERTFPNFSRKTFQQQYMQRYNTFVKIYKKKQLNQVETILSDDLFISYKQAVKKKDNFPFGNLQKVKNVKVVQGRVNSIQLSPFKASQRWFQLTCKFQSAQSDDIFYHVIQRNHQGKYFKILKFYLD